MFYQFVFDVSRYLMLFGFHRPFKPSVLALVLKPRSPVGCLSHRYFLASASGSTGLSGVVGSQLKELQTIVSHDMHLCGLGIFRHYLDAFCEAALLGFAVGACVGRSLPDVVPNHSLQVFGGFLFDLVGCSS